MEEAHVREHGSRDVPALPYTGGIEDGLLRGGWIPLAGTDPVGLWSFPPMATAAGGCWVLLV